ncbi:MAG: hypothetical protein Q8P20_00640 [bacterium]|nr:hypothetical protein [bacterium]
MSLVFEKQAQALDSDPEELTYADLESLSHGLKAWQAILGARHTTHPKAGEWKTSELNEYCDKLLKKNKRIARKRKSQANKQGRLDIG